MILKRLTIRARITVGSFLLAAVFFAGAALVVHRQVEGILNSATIEILESDAAPFTAPSVDLAAESAEAPGEGQLVAVIDPDGVVAMSTIPHALKSQIPKLVAAGPGEHSATTKRAQYRVLVTVVPTDAGDWSVITARSEASSRLILDRLTAGLAGGLVVLTVLFTGASWLLTGAALRPITRLRRGAEALVAEQSTALLPLGEARDEVSDLAATLNGLIAGLRAAAERERHMVSDASHELRTPLAVAQAQLELLAASTPAAQREDVASAQAAVHRLTRLVSSLLELSRLESRTGAGSASIAEMSAEIGAAVDRARSSVANAHIAVDYTVPGAGAGAGADTSVRIGMSAVTVGRVVDNLVENSIAALAGSGAIQVRLDRVGDGVRLVVADDGPGMPAEFIPRAFNRFSRADPVRRPHRGTGLGLAIVSAAVAEARGTIELESSSAGLRVIIRLPAVDPRRVQPESEGGAEDKPDAVGRDRI